MFFLIYIFFIKREMIKYAMDSNYDKMISVGNSLSGELSTTSKMSTILMGNSNITDYLKFNGPVDLRLHNNALMAMYDISNTFDNISSVYLFKNNGEFMHISKGVTYMYPSVIDDPEWIKEINERAGGYVVRINGNGAFQTRTGENIISLIRIVNDLDTQKPIGLLIINLSTEVLKDAYQDATGTDGPFCYYDSSGNILLQEAGGDIFSQIEVSDKPFEQRIIGSWNNERILSYYHVPDTPFIVAGIEDMSFTKYASAESIITVIIVVIFTFFCISLIGIFISVNITTPIERLVQSMDNVKTGWLRRVSLDLPNDEIGHLKDRYNNMLVEINRLIDELIEKEKKQQRAELEVLQEQIKPHFLYNTLDTIAYLTLENQPNRAYDAIETLMNFYRKFLSEGNREITIKEEIAIVKDYLKIQKLRYGEIFDDEYEFDESLLGIYVPKLILQPLVENSLYHGIRLKGEKGVIKITVYSKNQVLYIKVFDSGVGMSEEQIKEISVNDNRKHFGFMGTIDRIRFYCQKEDVFEIHSKVGEYTEVILKIPL